MKPTSQRSSTSYPAGSELLQTRFGSKTLQVLISMRPDRLVDASLLPEGDSVRVAHMRNAFQVIKDLTTLLSDARPDETLLLLCDSHKIYQAALRYLSIETAQPA